MMNHLKRILAWVMTAAMLVSACPTTAIAEEIASQSVRIAVQSNAEKMTAEQAYAQLASDLQAIADRVKAENLQTMLISGSLAVTPTEGQKTGDLFTLNLNLTFSTAGAVDHYKAFDENTGLFVDASNTMFDEYKNVKVTINAPEGMEISLNEESGWTNQLTFTRLSGSDGLAVDLTQKDVSASGSAAQVLSTGAFYARLKDNGEHAAEQIDLSSMVTVTADLLPKLAVHRADGTSGYMEDEKHMVHFTMPKVSAMATNKAEAKTWAVQTPDGETGVSADGDNVTFTYAVKTGAVSDDGMQQNSEFYTGSGVLDLNEYALGLTIDPVENNGQKLKPTSVVMTLRQGDSTVDVPCKVAMNANGTCTITPDSSKYNTAALANSTHANVHVFSDYTLKVTYAKSDFELDCDDERIQDGGKGLNVKLNAALTYKSYGDTESQSDTDETDAAWYYVKRDGGFITPEQYVKLAADDETRTEYRDNAVKYEIYKAADVETGEDGRITIKDGAKAADTVAAFAQSKELPEGTYYVVRKGMPEDYTNVKPNSYVSIGDKEYIAQAVTVTAKRNSDAEFEDYNAKNGALVLTKKFYTLSGELDENETLSASFTLTDESGKTYTLNAQNGEPTSVYLPAGEYTLEETTQSGYLTMTPETITIEAQKSATHTVENYPSVGELHLAAYLRKYSSATEQDAQNLSDYTVTIRDADGNVVDATIGENGVVQLPRKDADGKNITYTVTIENGEQTNGLFSHTEGDGQATGEDKQTVEISFADNGKLVQSVDYIFIRRQKLTVEKRLVDVTGEDEWYPWTIEVTDKEACDEIFLLETSGEQQTDEETRDLRGWDENGNVITYTVTEWEADEDGYTTTYSAKRVTLDGGDQKVVVTNTRLVGKTVFTKRGSDGKLLPGAEYAVIAKKADGSHYLVSTTSVYGVLQLSEAAVAVTEDGHLADTEAATEGYRFTTGEDGSLTLNLPVEEGTTYYMQELAAPAGYYLNETLIQLDVKAGEETTAAQVDQKKYELTVTKQFPTGTKAGSFATFTLYSDADCTAKVGEVTVTNPATSGVFTIPAYGTYYVKETAVSGDMMLNDSKIGPLAYNADGAAENPAAIVNEANVGKLNIDLIDKKKKALDQTDTAIDYADSSDEAAFTVSVDAAKLEKDSYAYKALTDMGFKLDETAGKLVYTGAKRGNQALELAGLPIYGDPNDTQTALTYTVEQTKAPCDYFLGETEDDVKKTFTLTEQAEQTLTFANEPKASLTVRLNYQKEFELKKGNAPYYPLTGAEMTLYEVDKDGNLKPVKSYVMDDTTLTISDLHGLKQYVLVETKTPTGYCAYSENDGHKKNEDYGKDAPKTLDDLKNFKYVKLTGREAANQNEQANSIITNYKDYAQLQLNKLGYTVLFDDANAENGTVIKADEKLDYCQFVVYAIRTDALTKEEKAALLHDGFAAPSKDDEFKRGTYTGKPAALTEDRINELIASKDAFTDGITYETGASGEGTGAFMTDAFELEGDIANYTFVFREVKINHSGHYAPIFGGLWAVDGKNVAINKETAVTAYNEADVVSGDESEFHGLFRVELDKQYWPTTADKDAGNTDRLRDLAGVTFELILAQKDEHGLLQAVEGDGAFKTEFVTGVENGSDASYGVSITVSLEALYKANGGAENENNPVTLSEDGSNYEADFILREAAYPINMVYVQEQYDLHVAVEKPDKADTVKTISTYRKNVEKGSIKNILGEMTYLTIAKFVDGERYYGGEDSTDAVYSIYNMDGTLYTTVTLNNDNHYETTVQLPRNTSFTLKETTAPVIGGVQTDRGGFVRTDVEPSEETTANRLTFTTGEYMSQIVVQSMNTTFHKLTVIKKDAGEELVEGAPIQISYASGEDKSSILNGNAGADSVVESRKNTDGNGEAAFVLPTLDYRTNDNDKYAKASYVISETHDYSEPVSGTKDMNRVVDSYFDIINDNVLKISSDALSEDTSVTVYNPATTSLTIRKLSDRTDGENGEKKPLAGVSFHLYMCQLSNADAFTKPSSSVPASGYYYNYDAPTTDANGKVTYTARQTDENGEITFDGLYSGIYRLEEIQIPQDQVNGGQKFVVYFRVICNADVKHIVEQRGETYTGDADGASIQILKVEGATAYNTAKLDEGVLTVTNTARAALEISKTFDASETQKLADNTQVSFTVYKRNADGTKGEAATLYDANWSKTNNPFTLSFSETSRSASRIVRLDPGEYIVEESVSTDAGYWFAKSAAYQNGETQPTLSYNGSAVENDRIISSQSVTVTKYNVLDGDAQRQMKVDFVNSSTLMGGSIYKTRHIKADEKATPLAGCSFALYILNEQNEKQYYAGREDGTTFGNWTASRTGAAKFWSDKDGMVKLANVYAPKNAAIDGERFAYYVEEISAPNPSYQLAYDKQIELAASKNAQQIDMVNTRGVSVQVRVFGSVRDNRDGDTPVVANATLHIMKRNAKGELEEIVVTGENGASQPYLYREVVSDANGDVLFSYLPRLEKDESYVVFEETDTGVIGDAEDQPYLNPVSQGYKAYYEFEATSANHEKAENTLTELTEKTGAYTVVTYDEVIKNPNELFSTLHFNAYNEPKGKLVILKRDYEDAGKLVSGARFSAEEQNVETGKKHYAFTALEPSSAARSDAPETLTIGNTTYTLSADKTHYTANGSSYTYVITTYVEAGVYAFAETETPNGYIATPNAQTDMPWYPQAQAELTNRGGYAAVAFANIPERAPYLSKRVVKVNDKTDADAKLNNLQSGDWQTVTFEIADATRDGEDAANRAIRYPMSRFVIADDQVDYRTVDGENRESSNWLSGDAATVQTQHFIDSVTVGQMGFDTSYGTAAGTRVYANVYGLSGADETLLAENEDVTDNSTVVPFDEETYTGFRIEYHTAKDEIPAGLTQKAPITVTMRVKQEDSAENQLLDRVSRVRNTAKLSLTYAIGEEEAKERTCEASAAVSVDTSLGLPKASVTKQVQRAEIAYDDNTGTYSVKVPEGENNPKSGSLSVSAGAGARYTIVFTNVSKTDENLPAIDDPILLDVLPRQVLAIAASAQTDSNSLTLKTATAPDGRTITVTGEGQLKAGESITLVVDALFDSERMLEQIIAGNTAIDDNIAYAMSAAQTVKNSRNPFGVPFTDKEGNAVTGEVKKAEGFEDQHALSARVTHTASEAQALTISKYVSGYVSGLDSYVTGSNVAITGAAVAGDTEVNTIRYRILVENSSTSPAKQIVVADELPHVGDLLNEGDAARSSRWSVTFRNLSVKKYGKNGVTEDTDYTVGYTDSTSAKGQYNNYFDNADQWNDGMAADKVRGFAVSVAQLDVGERLVIEVECAAPEVTDHTLYFTTANNNARLSYYGVDGQKKNVLSGLARVTIVPEKVWLGDRIWIDFNGNGRQDEGENDYAGALNLLLKQYYNGHANPTVMSQNVLDGQYRFSDLFAGVKNPSLATDPNDEPGNVTVGGLAGSEHYIYELELSGIPESYVLAPKSVNNPLASNEDSDFTVSGNGTAKTKRFYLPVITEGLKDDEKPGYPQVDAGLVPVRNLTITKKADNGADVAGAQFAIYGPYTEEELAALSEIQADAKPVGTMTQNGNVYSFVSTESAYLTYAGNYLVVEMSAPAPYLSTGAAFAGDGIEAHDEVKVNGAAHSCFVLKGMNSLPDDFKADERKTYQVNATDLYSAAGSYTLQARKDVAANGVKLDLYKNLFQIRITSKNDPNLTARAASTTNHVGTEKGAVIVTADANGLFSLTMNYATIKQDGWTERDWEGNTYTYWVEEINSDFDGVTYDKTQYRVTVTLEDDGNGNLTPKVEIAKLAAGTVEAEKADSIVFTNELARRNLTITKTTQGNAALDDEFTVELTLSRTDIVPVDGEYPIEITENGQKVKEDTLTVQPVTKDEQGNALKNTAKATLTLKNGQTAVIKDILVGTNYAVTEKNDRAQGYNVGATDAERSFTSSGAGTIATKETAKVDLVNIRNVGSLEISKTILGDDPVNERTFSFTARITYPDGVNLNDQDNLPVIPAESSLSVEGQTVTVSGIRITVSQDDRVNTAMIANILSGATYTVSEDEGFAEWGYAAYTTYTDEKKVFGREQSGEINGAAQTAAFTNVRSAGELIIGKTAEGTGVGNGLAENTTAYKITLTLHNDTVTLEGHVGVSTKLNADGQPKTYSIKQKKTQNGYDATVEMSLENGETVTFDKLPEGTTYSVVEDEQYRKLGFVICYEDGSKREKKNEGEIAEDAAALVQVVNTRDTHSVSITKDVLGQMANENDAFDFAVTIRNKENSGLLDEAVYRSYTYTVDGKTGTLDFRRRSVQTISLRKGETATILDVPDGAEITVVEKMTDQHKAEGYTLKSTDVLTDEKENIVGYTFTNERYMGELTITKALAGTGSGAGYGKTFKFDVRLWNERDLELTNAKTSTMPSGIKLTRTAETVDGHAVYTGTVSITMGSDGEPVTQSITNIPFDTHYEVTEQDEQGAGFNVGRVTPVYEGEIGLNEKEEVGRTVETAFTNERNIGALTLTKNAVGNAVKFDQNGNAEFSFVATLIYTDVIDLTQADNLPTVNGETLKGQAMTVDAEGHTVTLALAIPVTETARVGSLIVGNILEGTQYAVHEVFDAQEGYYLSVESESGSVEDDVVSGVIGQTLVGDAAFTNTRNVGALDVIKQLEGTGYNDRVAESDEVRTSFGFAVRFWRDDDVALTGDNQPTLNGEALALTAQTENGVTYYDGHITVDLSDGETAASEARKTTIGNILADTHFEVTEDENGYRTEGYVVSKETQSGVMTGEGDALRFVNTRDTGRLAIIKNLEGSTAEYGREFEFTVTLRRTDSIALAGTYRTLSGQKIVFTANRDGSATARVNVPGGSSVTIVGIPSGTAYAITEADYSSERYTESSVNANGTIVSDVTAQATFLNTRANPGYGALTVTKTVEAIGGAEIPDTKFTFDIALTLEDGEAFTGTVRTTNQNGETDRLYFANGTASIQLGDGESLTLSGIPLGTDYTVTERAAQDMRTMATGAAGTIRGTTHTAAFVNTMTQAYTDLTVRKAWNDANDAQKLRPQSVTVDVTRNGQTLMQLTLSSENRWTQTLTELPMFDDNGEAYVYDVRETDVPEGYTASVTARGMTFTVINTHRIDDGFTPVDPDRRRSGGLTILDDLGVPLGGGINMNEGDCFN